MISRSAAQVSPLPARGSVWTVFLVFLRLGCTSFGGPIAHIGYFRDEFVSRRRWLGDRAYADLVALCQFLPGPASSQVGFSIGLARAGYAGALAAWTGFTLPSALALVVFALQSGRFAAPGVSGVLHGLQLVAVAVVAQAVWGMARAFCTDVTRAAIAGGVLLLVSFVHGWLVQIASIALAAVCGLLLCHQTQDTGSESVSISRVSQRVAAVALAVFVFLLVALPLASRFGGATGLSVFNAFYRSGALVFGGGHVVLPLLRDAFVTPGWISDPAFLAGYGAAQAVPGPLFTFAAYLGAVVDSPGGVLGAAVGLVGIFLPGMLLLVAALPHWQQLRINTFARSALHGVNAAVVGLLAGALYNPIFVSSVRSAGDLTLVLGGWLALLWGLPPWLLVLLFAFAGAVLNPS